MGHVILEAMIYFITFEFQRHSNVCHF